MKFLERYPKAADGLERLKDDVVKRYKSSSDETVPMIITENLEEELRKLQKKD